MIRASTPAALDGREKARHRPSATAVAIFAGSAVVAASAMTAIKLVGGIDPSTKNGEDKGEDSAPKVFRTELIPLPTRASPMHRRSFAPPLDPSIGTTSQKLALRHTSAGDHTAEKDSNQPNNTNVSRRPFPKDKFRLRLHWHRGYIWQESPKEAWYCAACAVCDPDNIFGGLKNCSIETYCRENMSLAITGCDPKNKGGKSQKDGNGQPTGPKVTIFTRLAKTSRGIFDADNLDGDQIQVHDTNLCLQKMGARDVLLKQCNSSSKQQRFLGFTSGGQAFELVPLTAKEPISTVRGIQPKRCLTQHHEPRPREKIYAEECFKARRADTSFWTAV